MLKAYLDVVVRVSAVEPGEQIPVPYGVRNGGDERGLFWSGVNYRYDNTDHWVRGDSVWLDPGEIHYEEATYTMPMIAVDVYVEGYHFEPAYATYVKDAVFGPFRVLPGEAAPAAAVLEYRGPGAAKEGDPVGFVVTMVNAGALAGWIRPELNWTEDSTAKRATCSERWLNPGEEATFDVPFTMPGQTIDVYIHAHHWDYTKEAWITDTIAGPETVKLTGVPPDVGPVAEFVSIAAEDHARAGETIRFQVTLRNVGEGAGFLNSVVWWDSAGELTVLFGDEAWVEPGKGHIFSFSGSMPSEGIWVAVDAFHWDEATASWGLPDDYTWLRIDLVLGDWVHFQKAAAIRDALEPGSLTLQLYEWLAALGADVPPIMFEPEFWIERTFDEAIDEINVLGHLSAETQDELTRAFQTLQVAITKYDAWIEAEAEREEVQESSWWNKTLDAFSGVGLPIGSSLVDIIRGIVDEEEPIIPGWEDFKDLVKDLLETTPPFSWLYGLSSVAWSILQDFPEEVVAFFSNPADWIFDKVDDWLNEEAS